MAKRKKVLPVRKRRDRFRDNESLLMRSAEALGRMIGSLQRQLERGQEPLSDTADDVMQRIPAVPFVGKKSRLKGRKKSAAHPSGPRKRRSPSVRASALPGRERTPSRKSTSRKAAAG